MGKLFRVNCLEGKSQGVIVLGRISLGQLSGVQLLRRNYLRIVVREAKVWGVIVLGGISWGANVRGTVVQGEMSKYRKKDYFVSYINMTQSSLFFHIWTFFPGQLISKYLVIFSEVLHTVYFYLTLVFLNELKPSPKIKAAEFPNPCILFWSKHFVFPFIRTEYENFCAAECYFLTSDWFYASDKTPQSDIFQVVKKN